MSIPKTIYQTHELDYENLPDFQKDLIQNWKILNPGWQHVYMGAEERREYVKNNVFSSKMKAYDKNLTKIMQADLWRYLIIYNSGGFYADMDSICTMSLDTFLEKYYTNQEVVCTEVMEFEHVALPPNIGFYHWNCFWINNSNFGAIAKSLILKAVVDKVQDPNNPYEFNLFGPSDFNVPLLKNRGKICPMLHHAIHHGEYFDLKNNSNVLKIENGSISVNYLGNHILYSDLLKNNERLGVD